MPSPEPSQEGDNEEKKPTKKRKSWGQELPTPKTNLPPRFVLYVGLLFLAWLSILIFV